MPKSHFVNTDDPNLKEGFAATALCGEVVPVPIFGDPIDLEGAGVGFSPLLDCRKCFAMGFPHRYIYRIWNREAEGEA